MKEIGLLFTPENRELVRAGTKVQTRRLMKLPEWVEMVKPWTGGAQGFSADESGMTFIKSPYGMPQNDWEGKTRYYMKEPVQVLDIGPGPAPSHVQATVLYPDDGAEATVSITHPDYQKLVSRADWRKPSSSLFMLRSFARTWLPGVRTWPERLGDMSAEDAVAEGIECDPALAETNPVAHHFAALGPQILRDTKCWRDYLNGGYDLTPLQSYASLWNSINGKTHPWAPNLWTWAVEWQPPATDKAGWCRWRRL